jgi:hypothetical protein
MRRNHVISAFSPAAATWSHSFEQVAVTWEGEHSLPPGRLVSVHENAHE